MFILIKVYIIYTILRIYANGKYVNNMHTIVVCHIYMHIKNSNKLLVPKRLYKVQHYEGYQVASRSKDQKQLFDKNSGLSFFFFFAAKYHQLLLVLCGEGS